MIIFKKKFKVVKFQVSCINNHGVRNKFVTSPLHIYWDRIRTNTRQEPLTVENKIRVRKNVY